MQQNQQSLSNRKSGSGAERKMFKDSQDKIVKPHQEHKSNYLSVKKTLKVVIAKAKKNLSNENDEAAIADLRQDLDELRLVVNQLKNKTT